MPVAPRAARPTPPAAPVRGLLAELRGMVQQNAHRARRLILWRGLTTATAIILTVFLVSLAVDQFFHLPQAGRITVFALLVGCLLALIGIVLWQWRRVSFTEDGIALAMEQRSSNVDNRLINAIQLARENRGEPSVLNEAVIRENHRKLREVQMKRSASAKPVLIGLVAVVVICLVGVGFWWLQGNRFTNSAARILMPLADLNPLYRTVLTVEPGDTQVAKGSDVKVRIRIQGVIPSEIIVTWATSGKNDTETIRPAPGAMEAGYVFKQVQDDVIYSVRGGDYRSPSYTIKVPAPPALHSVKAEITPPAYTKAKPLVIDSSSGHLEALSGSQSTLHFQLDRAVDKAVLLVERPGTDTPEKIELKAASPTEYQGDLLIQNMTGYHLELTKGGQTIDTPSYGIRVLADQPPQLKLEGIDDGAQAEVDWTLPLTLTAEDDYGVAKTALAWRKVSDPPAPWQHITEWTVGGKNRWKEQPKLDLITLNLAEGDRIEIALLAQDSDPAKKDQWTESDARTLAIGGEGAQLQLLYEQILKTEADLKQLVAQQEKLGAGATEWIHKLESASGLRWDDQKNLDALQQATTQLAAQQEATRTHAGEIARAMPEASGNLRLSVGMLADTEMVRSTTIIESAPKQDTPQSKRAALAEAQMTQDRTAKSLTDIVQQYTQFREEWENDNITAFIGMLATRQTAMTQESIKRQKEPLDAAASERRAKSGANRQTRLEGITELAQTALTGVGERITKVEPKLGAAFSDTAHTLDTSGVKTQMQQAAGLLAKADWAGAAAEQKKAADTLQLLFVNLKVAAAEAARHANAEEEAKKTLEEQASSDKARTDQTDNGVIHGDLSVNNIVKMEETRQNGGALRDKSETDKTQFLLDEKMKALLAEQTNAGGPRPDIATLATRSSGPTQHNPGYSNLPTNAVAAPPIPNELHDIVGKLLDEADEMSKDFETINANTAMTAIDPGEVQKSGGRLNSMAAVSKTGNQKPPTTDSGGISGSGRQGARSHGQVADNTTVNRRGRDQAQEGQEDTPLQEGSMKEIMSDDPQTDSSTGLGGKKIESDDKNWSTKNAGEWKDSWASKMDAPQAVAKQADHKGAPMDPKVAELLRDMTSTQEQMIQRVKAIRKELNSLFLPTDRLDEILSRLQANLDKLKQSPDADIFRQQQETIDHLRSEMQVVSRAYSGFHPSLPRNRQLKGNALDEPATHTLPGYEDAVQKYYETLSNQ